MRQNSSELSAVAHGERCQIVVKLHIGFYLSLLVTTATVASASSDQVGVSGRCGAVPAYILQSCNLQFMYYVRTIRYF
jgi:hypothetical protein